MCLQHLSERSALRRRHPVEGLAIGGGGLLTAMLMNDPRPLAVLAMVMLVATVAIARPPRMIYAALVFSLLPFLVVASLALMISLDDRSLEIVWQASPQALLVFARALTCGLCSLFLAFAHPPESWVWLLGRAPLPRDLADLLSYALKCIFLFVDRAWHMHLAQSARLGHASWRGSLRSTGMLAANLWRQSFHDMQQWHIGISARAGTGSLRTLNFLPQPSTWVLAGSSVAYFGAIVFARLAMPGGGG